MGRQKEIFIFRGSRKKTGDSQSGAVLEIANVMEYDASGNLLLNEHMTEKCEYLDKVKGEKEKEYSDILGMEVYILLA